MTHNPFVDEVLDSAAATIRLTFRAMEIAEEEIAACTDRHPLASRAVHEAFGILCPNELLREASDRLYRAHCRELLDRVAAGFQVPGLSEPTAAELCAALSKLSLAAPLSHDYVVAYGEVFRRAFPDAEPVGHFGDLPESYPGRAEEIVTDLTRKIRSFCERPVVNKCQ